MKSPWLTLPFNQEDEETNSNGILLYNIKEDKVYDIEFLSKDFGTSHCVGSSHGCLVLMDEKANPYLLNPFVFTHIQLPFLETFECTKRVCKIDGAIDDGFFVENGKFSKMFFGSNGFKTSKVMQETFICKAILSADPFKEKSKWAVVVIYGEDKKLAYSSFEGSNWLEIKDAKHEPYCDIICKDDILFALGDESIESWKWEDLCFVKVMDINLPFPKKSCGYTIRDRCSANSYIVKSSEDILLVVRFIGEFVNEEGKLLKEEELLTEEDTHPLVCPYKTLFFHVYKLNFANNEWTEVNSLGDRALFLGGNHSVSISTLSHPECKKNSIYFSDDYWERVDEDYLYGGHDIGVYNVEDGSILPYCLRDRQKLSPVPFWIFS